MVRAKTLDFIEMILAELGNKVRQETNLVIEFVEERALEVQKRLLREVTRRVVLGAAGAFLTLGAFFFFKEYLALGNSFSFFIMGGFLLIWGIMLKMGERRKHYHGSQYER